GPRGAAGRVVGPIAIEPDDAEIDAPIHADHAGVLGDRIIDRVATPVVDEGGAAAEAPRDRLRGPRQHRGFADIFDADDAQLGIPEPTLFGAEVTDDAIKRGRIIAGRYNPIVVRSGQPEIL